MNNIRCTGSLFLLLLIRNAYCYGFEYIQERTICKIVECCNDQYIKPNFRQLQNDLEKNVFGQSLAQEIVVHALDDHFKQDHPKKALSLSFNGFPGTGKNYVTEFIVKNIYEYGFKSKYVRKYIAQIDFLLQEDMRKYQTTLYEEIKTLVNKCPRSLIIFDEVDKMPDAVLNILTPILDTHETVDGVDYRKAIFIFLSNTGGTVIAETLLKLMQNGTERRNIPLYAFEHLLQNAALTETGGLQNSDLIRDNAIDRYIPFLPMELEHVMLCIEAEFLRRNYIPTKADIKKVLQYISFDEEYNKKFSTAGCKRLGQTVATKINLNEGNRHRGEL